jgi:hypothetical protein
MARGMLVEPTDILSKIVLMPGKKYPSMTPISMAKKIQRVRYRSRNFSLTFIVDEITTLD